MKLTSRERLMLIILGIIAILAASYYLILSPQLEKISLFTIEEENVRQLVTDVKQEIASGGKLKASFEKEDKKIQEQSKRFYPEIFQPKLIVILDSLFKDAGIDVSSITYTPRTVSAMDTIKQKVSVDHPLKELTESYKVMTGAPGTKGAIDSANPSDSTSAPSGAGVQPTPVNAAQGDKISTTTDKMIVNIQYSKTNYEQITAFLKGLELQSKTLVIDNLSMQSAEDNLLSGTISVTFYAIPKLHDQDAEYIGWTQNNLYGKNNPFQ